MSFSNFDKGQQTQSQTDDSNVIAIDWISDSDDHSDRIVPSLDTRKRKPKRSREFDYGESLEFSVEITRIPATNDFSNVPRVSNPKPKIKVKVKNVLFFSKSVNK